MKNGELLKQPATRGGATSQDINQSINMLIS